MAKQPRVKAVGARQSAVAADVAQAEPGESGETVNEAAAIDGQGGEVVELSNDIDAEPRSMADDLKDIASAAGAQQPVAAEMQAHPHAFLCNLERDADAHPQGRQGCLIFDPPLPLPAVVAEFISDGVWRRDVNALWQFFVEGGGIVKMIRADMIHLREPPENVRELAA